MNVKIESLTAVKKRLEIEIPAERVQSELDRAYQNVKQKARIKGFRLGKLPPAILERFFGDEIRRDIRSKLIQESLPKLLDDHDLKVIGSPEIEPSEVKQGQGFRYTVTLEVMPQIELKEYQALRLIRYRPRIEEEDVNKRLLQMQADHAQLEPVEDRDIIGMGDVVVVDWESGVKGQKGEGEMIEIGSGNWRKEIEEGLVNVHRGEEKVIQIPPALSSESKGVSLRIRAREIKKKRLPPIDDDLAKEYGDCDNLEELKTKVRNDLQREAEEKESARLREELVTQLIAKNPFEIPEKAIERQLDFLIPREAGKTRETQSQFSRAETERVALRQKLRPQALRQVQRLWLLERIAGREGIRVEDRDFELEIEHLAEQTQRGISELRRFFAQEGRREELMVRIREKKTVELLIALAQVEEGQA
jgi:trigger factor